MWNIIQKGGPLMYLIILCSIVALAVVIERLYHLYRARINIDKFMEGISSSIKSNRIKEAIDLCQKTPGPVAHIVKAGILKHDRSRQEIKDVISSFQNIHRMESIRFRSDVCLCFRCSSNLHTNVIILFIYYYIVRNFL